MLLIKTFLFVTFIGVFLQDLKERHVYLLFFIPLTFCTSYLHYKNTTIAIFFKSLIINLGFITLLLSCIYLYSKYKLKTSIKNSFGLGDALFFIAISPAFYPFIFIFLFVFSLIFSLTLHLLLKKHSTRNTVPLAGYMSLFFCIVYLIEWGEITTSLYNFYYLG